MQSLRSSRNRRRAEEFRALAKLPPVRHELLPPLSEVANDVWEAVRSLPKRQAQVVALAYLDNASSAEIAEVLDIGAETVKTHMRRARARLAHLLADYMEE